MNTQARTSETAAAPIARNWTEALVAFQAADAAYEAQGRRWEAAHDALAADCPTGCSRNSHRADARAGNGSKRLRPTPQYPAMNDFVSGRC